MNIRVVIADDHTMLREGLSQALDSIPDIEVIASAADGRELLTILEEITPDVILVDIEMPRLSGIGALRRLEPPTAGGHGTRDPAGNSHGKRAAGTRAFPVRLRFPV